MSSFKKQAIKLKESLKEKGFEVPLVSIQEMLAKSYGFNNRHVVLEKESEFDEVLAHLKCSSSLIEANFPDVLKQNTPVIGFVNSLIHCAFANNAQEIHIIPNEKVVNYFLLINGEFIKLKNQALKSHAAICARIKVMAKFELELSRVSQKGNFILSLDNALSQSNLAIDVDTSPNDFGERIVLRLVHSGSPEYDRIHKDATFWDKVSEYSKENRIKSLEEDNKSLTDSVKSLLNTIEPFADSLPSPKRDKTQEDEEVVQNIFDNIKNKERTYSFEELGIKGSAELSKEPEDFEITYSTLSSEEAMAQAQTYADDLVTQGKAKLTSDMIAEIRAERLKEEGEMNKETNPKKKKAFLALKKLNLSDGDGLLSEDLPKKIGSLHKKDKR